MTAVGWGANQFSSLLGAYQRDLGLPGPVTTGLLALYVVGLLPGLLISLLTALIIALCLLVARKTGRRVTPDGRLARAAEAALLLAVGAALTILYAVPILWAAASYFGFTT